MTPRLSLSFCIYKTCSKFYTRGFLLIEEKRLKWYIYIYGSNNGHILLGKMCIMIHIGWAPQNKLSYWYPATSITDTGCRTSPSWLGIHHATYTHESRKDLLIIVKQYYLIGSSHVADPISNKAASSCWPITHRKQVGKIIKKHHFIGLSVFEQYSCTQDPYKLWTLNQECTDYWSWDQ